MQANAPTLQIVMMLAQGAMPANDIAVQMTGKGAVEIKVRLDDLVRDGLIVPGNGSVLQLTRSGTVLAGAFVFYRSSLLGLKEGQG
jgi:hypothetical protein